MTTYAKKEEEEPVTFDLHWLRNSYVFTTHLYVFMNNMKNEE